MGDWVLASCRKKKWMKPEAVTAIAWSYLYRRLGITLTSHCQSVPLPGQPNLDTHRVVFSVPSGIIPGYFGMGERSTVLVVLRHG